MTRLALIATASLILAGCKSEEPPAETKTAPPAPTQEELKIRGIELATLLNEKTKLRDQLDSIILKVNLDPDGRLKAINEALRQAETDFLEIRQNHPLLKKLNNELSLWTRNKRSASSSGRTTEAQIASEKIMQIRGKINEVSKTLPQIAAIQQARTDATQQIVELRRALAEKTPEGRELLDQLKAIERELEGL